MFHEYLKFGRKVDPEWGREIGNFVTLTSTSKCGFASQEFQSILTTAEAIFPSGQGSSLIPTNITKPLLTPSFQTTQTVSHARMCAFCAHVYAVIFFRPSFQCLLSLSHYVFLLLFPCSLQQQLFRLIYISSFSLPISFFVSPFHLPANSKLEHNSK
jgi:hypothetical protein